VGARIDEGVRGESEVEDAYPSRRQGCRGKRGGRRGEFRRGGRGGSGAKEGERCEGEGQVLFCDETEGDTVSDGAVEEARDDSVGQVLS
jgi:hypothetical protein